MHLVGTVKRIGLCEPEREHTKHREQKNNRGVEFDWVILFSVYFKLFTKTKYFVSFLSFFGLHGILENNEKVHLQGFRGWATKCKVTRHIQRSIFFC
jgi:hypothetical protein